VEIACRAGSVDLAQAACEEVEAAAQTFGSSGLRATALTARAMVHLAAGRHDEALQTLRPACRLWQDLDAPYNTAKVRTLLSVAYLALGDRDAAALELDAASSVFERLGAAHDLRRAGELRGTPELPGGLTAREAEVLRLVAAGNSNRQIAVLLVLSEKTVARHLANIFAKLELSSRTAAAGYAFQHGLAHP
jgi:DNA-binding CsgD family transcriptional regulator